MKKKTLVIIIAALISFKCYDGHKMYQKIQVNKSNHENLQQQIEEYKSKNKKSQEELSNLEQQIKDLRNKNKKLKEENTQLKNEVKYLQQELNE